MRRRPDGFDVAVMLVGLVMGWLIWRFPTHRPERELARSENRQQAMSLSWPRAEAGKIYDWNDPGLARWRNQPLIHRIRGRVRGEGRHLIVRPWLYTEAWLPQPTAPVWPDGRFEARVMLDGNYDAPLVLNLEVEDRDTHQVVASYNWFFRVGAR